MCERRENGNYSAYSPDLPGCVATGETAVEAGRNMREAIELHIQGLVEDHSPIPEPQACVEYATVR
jgi:predicted RNase H-like HicB family nuclease